MKAKTKEMADQVGAVYPVLFMGRSDGVLFTETELETFVDLVAAAEREECARLCQEIMQEHNPFDRQAGVARRCLDDIRARSMK